MGLQRLGALMSNCNAAYLTFQVLRTNGLNPSKPLHIIADGKLHRFNVVGDPAGSRNGYYITHLNAGVPGGTVGCWKRNIKVNWPTNDMLQSLEAYSDNYEVYSKRKFEEKQKNQNRISNQHLMAARVAQELVENCHAADPNHIYLRDKHIEPFCALQINGNLVLPIQDCNGFIWSVQYISQDGRKSFSPGGAISGYFIQVTGSNDLDMIYICEGYATAATIASNYPTATVIAATSCHNLTPVALNIRRYKPHGEIVICADDDRTTIGNPGLTHARKAAEAIGGLVKTISWPPGCPVELSDFNDLHCWSHRKGAANV